MQADDYNLVRCILFVLLCKLHMYECVLLLSTVESVNNVAELNLNKCCWLIPHHSAIFIFLFSSAWSFMKILLPYFIQHYLWTVFALLNMKKVTNCTMKWIFRCGISKVLLHLNDIFMADMKILKLRFEAKEWKC